VESVFPIVARNDRWNPSIIWSTGVYFLMAWVLLIHLVLHRLKYKWRSTVSRWTGTHVNKNHVFLKMCEKMKEPQIYRNWNCWGHCCYIEYLIWQHFLVILYSRVQLRSGYFAFQCTSMHIAWCLCVFILEIGDAIAISIQFFFLKQYKNYVKVYKMLPGGYLGSIWTQLFCESCKVSVWKTTERKWRLSTKLIEYSERLLLSMWLSILSQLQNELNC
jgi:hypothetical protein